MPSGSHDHRPTQKQLAARHKRRLKLVPLANPDERFRCASLQATMQRSGCASRYAQFNLAPPRKIDERKGHMQAARIGSKCTGCTIGAQHAAGKVHAEAPAVAAPVARGKEKLPFSLRIGVGT